MFQLSGSKHVDFARIYQRIHGLAGELPPVKARRRSFSLVRAFKALAWSVLALAGLVLAVSAFQAASVKAAYGGLRSGQVGLESALALAREGRFPLAGEYAAGAENDLKAAGAALARLRANPLFAALPPVSSALDDVSRLARAAEALSRAVGQSARLGDAYASTVGEGQTFTSLPAAQKAQALKVLYDSGPAINAIAKEMADALDAVRGIDRRGALWPLGPKMDKLEEEIGAYSGKLAQAEPATKLLPALLGYPKRSAFLFLLQNSDELRPTGGFIGTYGILETRDGEILRFDTHDIYHMDMPVKDKLDIAPPPALKKYLGVDKWFMRDANWSPHWPDAARKVEEFYHLQDRLLPPKDQINDFTGDFDAVLGVTPAVVTDLMALTGPVVIEGVEYNQGNFTELLQYRVERGYEQLGVSSWQRKEVIGDILSEMKSVLLNRPLSEVFRALDKVYANLERKDILVQWRDGGLDRLAARNNWNGAVRPTETDYIYVVDANMAAFKTDAVVGRKIEYSVAPGQSGPVANLKINYSHRGGFDWRTTRYRTYVRVYAPQGSRLLSAKGYADEDSRAYDEFGKAVFAGFVSIEPGQIGALELEYELPPSVSAAIAAGEYRLLVQRQPGARVEGLTVDLGFDRPVKSYSPTGFFALTAGDSRVYWEDDLERDKEYTATF